MSGSLTSLVTLLTGPNYSFGGIVPMVELQEDHRDEIETTLQPVELGAPVTDHAFRQPAELTLRLGWSNSGITNLLSVSALSDLSQAVGATGMMLNGSYVRTVYEKLLALQRTRTPFTIVTTKRLYTSMLCTSLETTTDASTYNALMITAACREIITVRTSSTVIAPQAQQANPASTAGTVNQGLVQLKPVSVTPPSFLSQITSVFSG